MLQCVPNRSQAAMSLSLSRAPAVASTRHHSELLSLEDVHLDIIYESDNYVIINKPYDVRMDGDFDVTIEKMLQKCLQKPTKWVHQLDYATSGVLCVALNRTAAAQATAAFEHRCTSKVYLAVLQGHLLPSRWPTLTSQAAEERRMPLPFGNKSHVKGKEKEKRKWKQRDAGADAASGTELGVETWQDRALEMSVDRHYQALLRLLELAQEGGRLDTLQPQPERQQLKRGADRLQALAKNDVGASHLSMAQTELLQKLARHPKDDFFKYKKLRKELRKVVSLCSSSAGLEQVGGVDQQEIQANMPGRIDKSDLPVPDHPEDRLETEVANVPSASNIAHAWEPYSSIYCEPLPHSHTDTPRLSSNFLAEVMSDLQRSHTGGCLLEASRHNISKNNCTRCTPATTATINHTVMETAATTPTVTTTTTAATGGTLHVDIPIADGLANEFRMTLGPGSAALPGRPSHTEITVLEHGLYQGKPVTKVLLRPISGRRHQLRLHTQAIGHPIVGDATYGSKEEGEVGEEAARMMLHAFRLRIDLMDPKGKPPRSPCDGGRLEACTSDPFPFLAPSSALKEEGGQSMYPGCSNPVTCTAAGASDCGNRADANAFADENCGSSGSTVAVMRELCPLLQSLKPPHLK